MIIFTGINFFSLKEGKFTSDLGEEIDPRNVRIWTGWRIDLIFPSLESFSLEWKWGLNSGFQVMESEPLGPHGVPSAAFKQKLGASRWDHKSSIFQAKDKEKLSYNYF